MMMPGVYVVEHKTTSLEIGAGSPYWKRLTLDAQVSTYLAGARAIGHEPIGVLYDVVRKPQIRPLKATPIEQREYTKPKDKACPECKKKNGTASAPHAFARTTDGDLAPTGPEAPNEIFCHEGRIVTDPGGKLYANMREFDETPEEFAGRLRADIAQSPDKYFQRGTIVRLEDEARDADFDAWGVAKSLRESQRLNRWPRNVDACDAYGSFCQYFDVCAGEAQITDPLRFRDADDMHEELASIPDDQKRRLPIVSSSSLKTYRSCPRKYFYAYELRRRSVFESAALRFGTLFHTGLEVWWKTVDLAQAFAAMAGEADPFELVKAQELMRGYHARWMHEPFDVLAVEQGFVAPLVNPETNAESRTWQRGGKIDAIVRVGSASRAAA